MPIPDYQSIMLPLLRLAGDGQEHLFRDTVDALATQFKLTSDERQQSLPSKTQPVFDNRVGSIGSSRRSRRRQVSAPPGSDWSVSARGRVAAGSRYEAMRDAMTSREVARDRGLLRIDFGPE